MGFRDPQIFHFTIFGIFWRGWTITWSPGTPQGSICRRRRNACAWSEAEGCAKNTQRFCTLRDEINFGPALRPCPPYLDTSSILLFAGQFWAELKDDMVSSKDLPVKIFSTQPIHCQSQVLPAIISHFHCIPMRQWEFPRIFFHPNYIPSTIPITWWYIPLNSVLKTSSDKFYIPWFATSLALVTIHLYLTI